MEPAETPPGVRLNYHRSCTLFSQKVEFNG
jgi:hypothetical protein